MPEPELSPALGELAVNGVKKGNTEFFIDANGQPYIGAAALAEAVAGIARPESIAGLAVGDGLVSAGELAPSGLDLSFDQASLGLRLDVAPRARLPFDLTAKQDKAPKRGEVKLRPEGFAASLGLGLDLDPKLEGITSKENPSLNASLDLRPAVYLQGLVAEADAEILYTSAFSLALNGANLVYDFPAIRGRLMGGIVGARSVGFQTSSELLGLSFYRDTGTFPVPGGRHRTELGDIVLERSAKVTVEMNGAVLRQFRLDPGSYQLSDLPCTNGLNEVTVRIEEEGKEPFAIRAGIPFNAEILDPGELDYALALGANRKTPSRFLAEGNASLGLTKEFAAGIDAEAGYGSLMAGLSALWASPLGNIGLKGALAAPYEGEAAFTPAFAGLASWRFSLPAQKQVPSMGLALRYRSPGFAPPQEDATSDPARGVPSWQVSAQLGQPFVAGGNLGLFGDLELRGGSLYSATLAAGLSFSLKSYTSASVELGFDWKEEGGLDPHANFSLSIIPPDNGILQYKHDFLAPGDSLDISVSKEQPAKSSLSFQTEGLVGEAEDRSAGLSWQSRTRYFNLGASASYGRSFTYGTSAYGLGLSASTTVATAGGYTVAASSLGNALAILVPAPSLGTDEVELMSQNGSSTASLGGKPALVSGMRPYASYIATIETPESPPDLTPSPRSVELFPGYKSITIIKVRAAPSISVGGRVIDAAGKPLANMAGDLLDEAGEKKAFAGTFTDEAGLFECYGLDSGEHTILWGDGTRSSFTIAKDEERKMIELGDIPAALPNLGGGSAQ
jgi:outer membrane usher protein